MQQKKMSLEAYPDRQKQNEKPSRKVETNIYNNERDTKMRLHTCRRRGGGGGAAH